MLDSRFQGGSQYRTLRGELRDNHRYGGRTVSDATEPLPG